jgi:ABC-2 type transport system permease protein
MISLKLYRVWATTLRYLHQSTRDLLTIADFIYWPLSDLILWGMMTLWLERAGTSVPHIVIVTITGYVFWQIVYQANMDITNSLIDEFWCQNLVNMFSSPLTLNEWIAAVMLLGTIRTLFLVLMGTFVSWLLYSFNVLALGWILLPSAFSLLITGWSMGFCSAAFILYGGMRAHWSTWAVGALMSPFISIYYPIDTLPTWAQKVAYVLPPTYIFENLRTAICNNIMQYNYIIISLLMSTFYLVLSLIYFKYMFEQSRIRGLARIE